MLILGLDFGGSGAAVVSDPETRKLKDYILFNKSTHKEQYDFFKKVAPDIEYCNCELLHAIYGTSAKSNFTYAKNIGRTEAFMIANDIPYREIKAKQWQAKMFHGMPSNLTTKEKSKELTLKLFPGNPHPKDDNFCDAYLLSIMDKYEL